MQRRAFTAAASVFAAGPAWLRLAHAGETAAGSCGKVLYLTFDTGHMGIADLVARVLRKHRIQASFFAANEATQQGDGSLGSYWAPWWKARADEGHALASHTYDHMYWLADVPDANRRITHFKVRLSAGPRANQSFVVSAADYGAEIARSNARLREITGHQPLPLYRAPGGKTSPALLSAARQAGFAHVGWSSAGFLGDELPSDKYPNDRLLSRALASLRSGDILLAHLGIWSRKDPWAPAVLEPLIEGLLARGFCFRTLRDHPQYREWIAKSA